MFKWFMRYINDEAKIQSEEALLIYHTIIVAAKPLTLRQIQESTAVIPEYVRGILENLVRNKMLVVSEQQDDKLYDFTPESYRRAKTMLQSLQLSPAVRARSSRRFSSPKRFRNRGPRPIS